MLEEERRGVPEMFWWDEQKRDGRSKQIASVVTPSEHRATNPRKGEVPTGRSYVKHKGLLSLKDKERMLYK